jgi:hypothetical protein
MKDKHGIGMRARIAALVGTLVMANLAITPALAKAIAPPARTVISGAPLGFEPNVGQGAADGQYFAHGPAYAIALTGQGAALAVESGVLRLQIVGSRADVKPSAEQPLPGVVNYFIGNDPKQWRAGIKTYGKVRYSGVYPGVDLIYYGTQGRLEYDFALAAGASVKPIRLAFEGAELLRLDERGALKLQSGGHDVAFEPPVAYQIKAGHRAPVVARYRLSGNTVRFEVGAYDHSKALIIDPVLAYFSYLGGSNYDVVSSLAPTGGPPTNATSSQAAAVDSAGDLYVTGYTTSTNFPTKSAFAPPPSKGGAGAATWAFVTKFAPDAKSLIFSTYMGGSLNNDQGYGIAVDASGNAFVVGQTGNNDFPVTTGAYQTVCSPNFGSGAELPGCTGTVGGGPGAPSAFVAKLSPSGALLDATFLSGTATQSAAYAVAVDSAGRAYVAGWTYPGANVPAGASSTQEFGFPTTAGAVLPVPPYQTVSGVPVYLNANQDAFISVFNPTLSTLMYSSLFGDTQIANGNIGFQSSEATYGTAVAVDASGNFYLAGNTADPFLPVSTGTLQPQIASCGVLFGSGNPDLNGTCGFVAKFSPVTSASTLTYGTYLGHMPACCSVDYVSGIAADAAGDAYVVGYTNVATFPTTTGAYQASCNQYPTTNSAQCASAFIAKLNPTGTTLLASTYFGGSFNGQTGIADSVLYMGPVTLDAAGNVYIAGTSYGGLPQVNGLSSNNGAGNIASPFVAELNASLSTLQFSTLIGTGGQGQLGIGGMALDTSGNIYLAGSVNSPPTSAATSGAFQAAYGGGQSDGYVAKIVVHTPTTTTLSAAPTSAASGTAVNLTATVAEVGGTGVPTGTVTFKDGTTTLGSMTLNGTGIAVYTTSTLSVGAHSITAAYGGDAANGASTSTASSVTITAAPTPTVTIAVAPTSITLGQSATLTWSSTNATACTASNAWTGTQAVSGTHGVTPAAAGSLSYVLTCTGAGGSGNATATLTVTNPLPTVTLAVAPTSITVGQSATLTWSSTNATACTASNAWTGTQAVSGTQSVTPTAAGSLSYVLTCTGAGGSGNATATLTVTSPLPTVTIGVSPSSITVGQSATLTWSSTNATACTASGSWTGTQATSGTLSVSPTAAGAASYVLACTGAGGTVNGTAALTVNAPPGKSGGGSIGLWELIGLALLGLTAHRRRVLVP